MRYCLRKELALWRVYSLRVFLFLLGERRNGGAVLAGFELFQSAAGSVLLGLFLGGATATGQRLSSLALGGFETDLDQKTLAMVRTALALQTIHRRPGMGSLQMLLQRRLIIAQRGALAQLAGQLLGGLSHNVSTGEVAHRFQTVIEKHGGQNRFKAVGQNRVAMAQTAFFLASAEQHKAAQVDLGGHLGQMLAADQHRANAGQRALTPLRMQLEEGFGHHEAEHGVAQVLQPFVVSGGGNSALGILLSGSLIVGQGAMCKGSDEQARIGKPMAENLFELFVSAFQINLVSNNSGIVMSYLAGCICHLLVDYPARRRMSLGINPGEKLCSYRTALCTRRFRPRKKTLF